MSTVSAFDRTTGQRVQVPAEQAGDLFRAGTIAWRSEDRVAVRRPDGGLSEIEARELGTALGQGYSIVADADVADLRSAAAREERFGTARQVATTALEGAARGATFGVSDMLASSDDVILRGLGRGLGGLVDDESSILDADGGREAMLARQATNPNAALAGELGGAVVGGVAGAGRAGLAIERAATRAVGRSAPAPVARVVGAATAGEVEGALAAVGTEVGRASLADEELTGEALATAAGRGVFAGFLGGAGASIGSQALGAGVRRALGRPSVDRALGELAVGGLGSGARLRTQLAADGLDTAGVGRALLDEGDLIGPRVGRRTFLQRAERRVAESAAPDLEDAAARLGQVPVDADGLATRLARLGEEAGEDAFAGVRARLQQRPGAAALLDGPSSFAYAGPTAPTGPMTGLPLPDIAALRAAVDEELLASRLVGEATASQTALAKARADIAETTRRAVQSATGPAREAFEQASRRYAGLQAGRDIARRALAGEGRGAASRRGPELGLPLALAAITGSPEVALVGWLTGGLRRWAAERGSSLAASGLDSLAKRVALPSVQGALTDGTRRAARALVRPRANAARGRLSSRALELSFRDAVSFGQSLPTSPEGFDAPREDGSRPSARDVRPGDVAEQSVLAAATMMQAQIRGAEAIRARLPAPSGDLQSHLEEPGELLTDQEKASFVRYVEAVRDPMGVVADVSRGTVTPEQAEALREVYPRIYAQLLDDVREELSTSRTRIPYEQQIQLSMLFPEIDVDRSLRGESIARAQRRFLEQAGGAQGGAAGGPPSRSAPDLAASQTTEAQRLEEI